MICRFRGWYYRLRYSANIDGHDYTFVAWRRGNRPAEGAVIEEVLLCDRCGHELVLWSRMPMGDNAREILAAVA